MQGLNKNQCKWTGESCCGFFLYHECTLLNCLGIWEQYEGMSWGWIKGVHTEKQHIVMKWVRCWMKGFSGRGDHVPIRKREVNVVPVRCCSRHCLSICHVVTSNGVSSSLGPRFDWRVWLGLKNLIWPGSMNRVYCPSVNTTCATTVQFMAPCAFIGFRGV